MKSGLWLACTGLTVSLAGCVTFSASLEKRNAIVACLPPGYQLSTGVRVEAALPGLYSLNCEYHGCSPVWCCLIGLHKVTLEEELARLGAQPGKDGKLYDASGKEIYFWDPPLGGPCVPGPTGPSLEELEKRYRVIEFHYWEGAEKGAPEPLGC